MAPRKGIDTTLLVGVLLVSGLFFFLAFVTGASGSSSFSDLIPESKERFNCDVTIDNDLAFDSNIGDVNCASAGSCRFQSLSVLGSFGIIADDLVLETNSGDASNKQDVTVTETSSKTVRTTVCTNSNQITFKLLQDNSLIDQKAVSI